jgi:ring-1,2-phenylacetyl-CoA epoxidase subunit PaaC
MNKELQKYSPGTISENVTNWVYILHLADNSLILGQRNAEWCGHGPVLEQDIAITNISLDLIGQARNLYQYAAQEFNSFSEEEKQNVDKWVPALWKTFNRELNEDDLAFLRAEQQYVNLLITELPKGDWAQTILKQFFFSAFQQLQFTVLHETTDNFLKDIAEKSLKEINYHLRWSAEWVIRLGDGTEESKNRINAALEDLWMFTGEFFQDVFFDPIDNAALKESWLKKISEVFTEAELTVPKETKWFQTGGKKGIHTEHLGYLLTDLQYLQRTYPNATW